ncbi:MAG: hypothetical protein ABW252_21675 [Polyangiales bacterium]
MPILPSLGHDIPTVDPSADIIDTPRLAREFEALARTDLGALETRMQPRSAATHQPVEHLVMSELLRRLRAPSCLYVARKGAAYGVPHGCVEDVVQDFQLSFARRARLEVVPRSGDAVVLRPIYQRSLINAMIDFARKHGTPRAPQDGETPKQPKRSGADRAHHAFDDAATPLDPAHATSPELLAHYKRRFALNLAVSSAFRRVVLAPPRPGGRPETVKERSQTHRDLTRARQEVVLDDDVTGAIVL